MLTAFLIFKIIELRHMNKIKLTSANFNLPRAARGADSRIRFRAADGNQTAEERNTLAIQEKQSDNPLKKKEITIGLKDVFGERKSVVSASTNEPALKKDPSALPNGSNLTSQDSICSKFNFGSRVLFRYERCCVDGSSTLFAYGQQCAATVAKTAMHAVKRMPNGPVFDRTMVLRGRGLLIDCSGRPSHVLMGLAHATVLAQATVLMDWLKSTGGSFTWVVTHGCNMHAGTPVSAAIQTGLDQVKSKAHCKCTTNLCLIMTIRPFVFY